MSDTPIECRSEEGITIGLIDSFIAISRVLAHRNFKHSEVQEALIDLYNDPDFNRIRNQSRQANRRKK